jgi:hypothetical protein
MMDLVVTCKAAHGPRPGIVVAVSIGGIRRTTCVPGELSSDGLAKVTATLEADLLAEVTAKVAAQKREARHAKAVLKALEARAMPATGGDE